jgi:tetratricopeptide (TPR) repeat protein
LDQARRDLERAILLKPNLIAPYLNLAQILDELNQEAAALEILDKAIDHLQANAMSDDDYRAYLHRGNIYLQQGNYEAAITDYKAATRLAPQDAAAFFNLGTAYQAINDYKAARKAFEDTIQRAPGHAPAFQSLGEAALELGDTKSAETAFSNSLRLTREADDKSGQAQAHLSLGRLYASLDDRQVDAERELRQAIGLDEGLVYTESSYELGLLLMAANRLDEAISFFTNSAELFDVLNEPRSSVRANLQLGRAYQAKQNPAAALEALDRASTRLASVFDPLNPEDEQLQQAVETERNRLDRQPLPEDQP